MVAAGSSEREIADALFGTWLRYYRGIERYRRLCAKPRDFQREVLVYWGPSSTGKSRHALELAPDAFWVARPHATGGAVWWDGYEGQENVVIDEFYGWISRDSMQRAIDRYPLQVQTKLSLIHI